MEQPGWRDAGVLHVVATKGISVLVNSGISHHGDGNLGLGPSLLSTSPFGDESAGGFNPGSSHGNSFLCFLWKQSFPFQRGIDEREGKLP